MAQYIAQLAGNICVGKSTLAAHMQEHSSEIADMLGTPFSVFLEPVDEHWRRLFYSDRAKFTLLYELSCILERVKLAGTVKDAEGVVILERGIVEGFEVFGWNSHDEGYLDANSYAACEQVVKAACDGLGKDCAQKWSESDIIFLQADLDTIVERNARRAREEGLELIPREYLERIGEMYERRYIGRRDQIFGKKYGLPVPGLLTIDASTDFRDNPSYLHDTTLVIVNNIQKRLREMRR